MSSHRGWVRFAGVLALLVGGAVVAGLTLRGRPTPARAVVRFAPDSVVLDYRTGEMVLAGQLTYEGQTPPPVVWVWAYFVNPGVEVEGSWSDAPIAVGQPFAQGNPAPIAARGSFHWATNTELPRRGYVARVYVSAEGRDAVTIPSQARDRSASGGLLVRTHE